MLPPLWLNRQQVCVSCLFLQVPRVFVGEKCVGGGSDVVELHESGQLEGMLQSIGALQ